MKEKQGNRATDWEPITTPGARVGPEGGYIIYLSDDNYRNVIEQGVVFMGGAISRVNITEQNGQIYDAALGFLILPTGGRV